MTVNLTQYFDPGLLYVFLVFVISAAVCDVCGPGHYGGNCSNVCPSECKDGLCRPSGLCEDCRDGFYGMTCSQSCPSTCPDNLCHRFNVSCKKECSEGIYGKKCDKQCSGCPGPCHWSTGECIGNSSEKPDLPSVDHQSQTHTPTDQTTHSTLTTDARGHIAVVRPRCREGECWIEFNGWPVCHYGCADGTRGTACAQTRPRKCTQYERHVTSCISNVSRLYGESCNSICFGLTGRCFNESNSDESLKIQHVEACSQNCSNYCRNLSVHDTGPCVQLSTACVDECVHDYIGALCEHICDRAKESEPDTTPPRGGRPNIIIITIIITIIIVITASCILLAVRCWSNRPSASSPSLPAARDVDDVVNMTDDRDGNAGDGLREVGDMGATFLLSASYLSAVHRANRDTEDGDYAVPDNHWKISEKHQPPPSTSYISPVHNAVYSEVEDGRTRPIDHRQLFGDYHPCPVNDNQACDLSARGVGYSNPYGARNSTGNARVPPQEHYESLNRFQHIDPNRLYSFLEIGDEETNVSTDTS
ncbi:scavenger receptor class F member 1-like [Haliotis rubra]|uniref:scavenger receptor class F member 1-like n=1 Tax=Haliotis rubra TaxID=36100 RepID=UPI001EE538F2|nr:scavenger receptor class F member 1-like [Haliotis rubra]